MRAYIPTSLAYLHTQINTGGDALSRQGDSLIVKSLAKRAGFWQIDVLGGRVMYPLCACRLRL